VADGLYDYDHNSGADEAGELLPQRVEGDLKNKVTDATDVEKDEASPDDEGSCRPRLAEKPAKRRVLSNRIIVTAEETPARRLVLKMVELQEQLAVINNRVMSGLAVTEEDWATVRRLSSKLGSTFDNEVEFAWEKNSNRRHSSGGEIAMKDEATDTETSSRERVIKEEPEVEGNSQSVRFECEKDAR
jgi:hypothetical protein